MAVFDKVKSTIQDFFNSTFGDEEDEGIFKEMMGVEDYATDGNAALDKVYTPKDTPNSKVVNLPSYKGYEVLVCEPRAYEESMTIVKHLKDRKTVILNLHLLDREQSMRLVDFVCGASHALMGNQQRIGDSVFIFTPSNVNLSSTETQKAKSLSDSYWAQPL
ncbi:cell division protein SepF [bacterium]|nr:cell division protein SepF [bacterium]